MKTINRLFLCVFLLVCLVVGSFAQPIPDWVERYNGPAGQWDGGRAIARDHENNIYIVGASEGKKGNRDIVTIKYGPEGGTPIWIKRYNGPGNGEDYPYAIYVDGAGNVYVTGKSLGSGTDFDFVTIKYNNDGIQQWIRRTAGTGYDVAKDVNVDADGNVYVTGHTNGNFISGNQITTIKYNAAGDLVWRDDYDGQPSIEPLNNEEGNSIAIDAAGNVYITGKVGSQMVTIKYKEGETMVKEWVRNCSVAGTTGQKVVVDGSGNIVVTGWGSVTAKYAPNGDLLWQTVYPGNAAIVDMAVDDAHNIYVIGYSNEQGTGEDYRTIKYTPDGLEAWSQGYNGTKNISDLARGIALDAIGNVYVTGFCVMNDGSRNGKRVFGTVKYDNDGTIQWAAFYDGDGFGIVTDDDNNVCVTGQGAVKTNFDIVTIKYPASNAPAAIVKAASSSPAAPQSIRLSNYPNPFTNATTIEFEIAKEGRVLLTVTDLLGNGIRTLVNEVKKPGIYRVHFDVGNLNAGTYFYRIQSGEQMVVKKMIIVN